MSEWFVEIDFPALDLRLAAAHLWLEKWVVHGVRLRFDPVHWLHCDFLVDHFRHRLVQAGIGFRDYLNNGVSSPAHLSTFLFRATAQFAR